jgi:Ulp1 family protease
VKVRVESGVELIREKQAAAVARAIADRRAHGTQDKKRNLTQDEVRLVLDLFRSRGTGKVAYRFGTELMGKDIQCLGPGKWLNDEVMNFQFQLMRERSFRDAQDMTRQVRAVSDGVVHLIPLRPFLYSCR